MNVLLFGASGNLGRAIAKEAMAKGYTLTSVVRNAEKGLLLSELGSNIKVANIANGAELKEICKGYDVVISALGKSVSPNDGSKDSFEEIDFKANAAILADAVSCGIKKFVYVSAFHAERYQQLTYFKVHHDFSELLIKSGLDYAILKPPALFSGFLDMIAMAKKGQLVNIGKGDKQTNPIHEADVAKETFEAINKPNAILELGGKNVYTRKQLYEIIQTESAPNKSLKQFPLWAFKLFLPLLKLVNRNMFDKFAFFSAVIQHNTVAPQVGESRFEDYIKANS